MSNLTKEEADEMLKEFDKSYEAQTAFLAQHGWEKGNDTFTSKYAANPYQADCWTNPKTGKKYHPCQEAYDALTTELLKENGWRNIVQVKVKEHNGKHEEWARYQSPKTKRIYSFLEAQDIMASNWDEDLVYPDTCSWYTLKLNELVGDNFEADKVFTELSLIGEEKTPKLELHNGILQG